MGRYAPRKIRGATGIFALAELRVIRFVYPNAEHTNSELPNAGCTRTEFIGDAVLLQVLTTCSPIWVDKMYHLPAGEVPFVHTAGTVKPSAATSAECCPSTCLSYTRSEEKPEGYRGHDAERCVTSVDGKAHRSVIQSAGGQNPHAGLNQRPIRFIAHRGRRPLFFWSLCSRAPSAKLASHDRLSPPSSYQCCPSEPTPTGTLGVDGGTRLLLGFVSLGFEWSRW